MGVTVTAGHAPTASLSSAATPLPPRARLRRVFRPAPTPLIRPGGRRRTIALRGLVLPWSSSRGGDGGTGRLPPARSREVVAADMEMDAVRGSRLHGDLAGADQGGGVGP